MRTVGEVVRALSRFDEKEQCVVRFDGTRDWGPCDRGTIQDVWKECKGGREAVVIYTSTGSGR